MENNLFKTPALWYPNQDEDTFDNEIELMLIRAKITNQFLQGQIAADSFLDFLDKQEFDVFDLVEDWLEEAECL